MRMKNHEHVVSVGVDVCKSTLDVAYLTNTQTAVIHSYDNTVAGITNFLRDLKTQKTAKTVPCVIESTGNAHFLVTLMVSKAGYAVKCINPLITKKYQRSSIRNAKSDRVDARRLADIGLLEPNLRSFQATEENIVIAKIIASLATCEKLKQKLTLHRKQFVESLNTIGESLDTTNYDTALVALNDQIGTLRAMLVAHAPEEAAELATHTKGLSTEQASVLLASLKDKHFTNRDQLVAFLGLDIMSRKSGAWVGKQKLSKRGNAYLRKILYQIAWGLKTHDDTFRTYYEKLRKKGHHYTTCLIAVARKFVRYLFAYYYKHSVSFPQG
jgi:transposase